MSKYLFLVKPNDKPVIYIDSEMAKICAKTFETASGYTVICHLDKGHKDNCEGVILGSTCKWNGKYNSEYEQYLDGRKPNE